MIRIRRTSLRLLLAATMLWSLPGPVRAAVNVATGGIGGIDNGTLANGDGNGAAQFELNTLSLALVKQARDAGGAVLPDGAIVAPGQELTFVLYIDNPTDFAARDIEIVDPLDETQFSYVPGSLEETIVPSGAGDAAIWAGAWTALTDAVGAPDDVGSSVDTGGPPEPDRVTIGTIEDQANQTVDIPARSLLAFRFRVRVN